MRRISTSRLEQVAIALVITLVLMGLAALIPAVAQRLGGRPTPTAGPKPTPTAPPAAVLLPDELDRDLQGVMTIVNDHTFGTGFLIDPQGDFVTAASLVSGSQSLRLIDNTGGSHPVRLVGVNAGLGVALVRAATDDGLPMAFGEAATLQPNDPVVLLASPKVENLRPSTPAVITGLSDTQLILRVDDVPGSLGGPVVGPGGKVLGVLTREGMALPVNRAQPDIAKWRGQTGTAVALAPMPANLVLRGSDTTNSPTGGPTVQSVSPPRASTAQDTLVTVQGSGFVNGPMLHVRFVPLASPSGGFDGVAPTLVNPSTLTVKVPAGQVVQDYVVQLTNGDGTVTGSRAAFTVTS